MKLAGMPIWAALYIAACRTYGRENVAPMCEFRRQLINEPSVRLRSTEKPTTIKEFLSQGWTL